ncbi:MAG: 16S rRNA (adenine(1518)-N(6)/adenine(1519)-N(6))-dimethyltransferase RsmA [Propionibacteriaceae bacterium]|jgi:16S rRNA (adenine1518-N6/adenine1519-N6)-dimethyltransferase|nr:16S rRNA (adenine(1518)-N(6)/adenine(1519)-N(6))-dimethyltransferase RsmA [Propionibacteriaceae bacterium]
MALLGGSDIRALAAECGLAPSKKRGQNFVHDANTVRRIVAAAGVSAKDVVLEVGPGFGSLTLGLLEAGARVVAVEIDGRLAALLPQTVAARLPQAASRLQVVHADALDLPGDGEATVLVANLPYNVSVPVILHVLERYPALRRGLVMVQLEVAERLVARPGSKAYGAPSVKLAWYADARKVGTVPAGVFWPVPHVESGLVAFERTDPPPANRDKVFSLVNLAFSQRRKMLRSVLAPALADPEAALRAAGIPPTARGETLDVADFARLAQVADG